MMVPKFIFAPLQYGGRKTDQNSTTSDDSSRHLQRTSIDNNATFNFPPICVLTFFGFEQGTPSKFQEVPNYPKQEVRPLGKASWRRAGACSWRFPHLRKLQNSECFDGSSAPRGTKHLSWLHLEFGSDGIVFVEVKVARVDVCCQLGWELFDRHVSSTFALD